MKKSQLAMLFTTAVLVVCGGLLLWKTGFFTAIGSVEEMRDYIERFTPYSHLFFFFIQWISVVLAPIPSNITALAGGVLFGFLASFLLSAGAVVLGSMTVFFCARLLGQRFADGIVGRKISERYLELIRRKRDVVLILVFLFPFFPDDVICILAGLTTISAKRFLCILVCTRPWGMLVSCAVGSAAFDVPWYWMAGFGILGILFFVLALRYGDQWEEAWIQKWNQDIRKKEKFRPKGE